MVTILVSLRINPARVSDECGSGSFGPVKLPFDPHRVRALLTGELKRRKSSCKQLGSIYTQLQRMDNGYCESFNARLRDELLNGEVFYSLREAQIIIEKWRKHYNTKRPHSALGYRPPAPETIVPMASRPIMH